MSQSPIPKAPVLVAAAIITDGDRLLIARRKLDAKIAPGMWEFPGGKIEHGEHPEATVVREIREELNLEVAVDGFFDLVSHIYESPAGRAHVVILAYRARLVGGELKFLDVADAKWIRASELAGFDFAHADLPFVEKLLNA